MGMARAAHGVSCHEASCHGAGFAGASCPEIDEEQSEWVVGG
jgi:hypothetical protein